MIITQIYIQPRCRRCCRCLERVSIECRKTKTKVITLANQKGRRQSSKPIKTWSNIITGSRHKKKSAGKCACVSSEWLKKCVRTLNQSLSEVMQNQSNSLITFDTQLKAALNSQLIVGSRVDAVGNKPSPSTNELLH